MNRRSFLRHGMIAAGAILLPRKAGVGAERIPVERTCYAMGTTITIQAWGLDHQDLHRAITRAVESFYTMDRLMSVFDPRSDVSLLNAAAGKDEVKLHDDVLDVLSYAQNLTLNSGGYFNVLVEPLMRRWGFRNTGPAVKRPPSDKELYTLLEALHPKNLLVDRKNSRAALVSPLSSVDLGGIAVGFSVDRAMDLLRQEGVENAFINHSGDAAARGNSPDEEGWKVRIPDPVEPDRIMAEFVVRNESVSTSGNYRSFVPLDDRRFGHILDPLVGRPAEKLLSLTVVAPRSLDADALSTARFASGFLGGLQRFHAVSMGEDSRPVVSSHGI